MSLNRFLADAAAAGCPRDQVENFLRAGLILQPKQLAASAAARHCDLPDGPTAIGFGGARGGGKSHWLVAQLGADDCQRVPGLKCLLLRKVGKSNRENFGDLRLRVLRKLPHSFAESRGLLTFANGSRIICGHFQNESDIDAYLGLEYDVIGIEEATTLSARKHQDITTCCRTSRSDWRPRIYSTANPGGVGHAWYKKMFIDPYSSCEAANKLSTLNSQLSTIFIPSRVTDNHFTNVGYRKILQNLTGWKRRAWLDGDWDIAAGQFFTTFRRDIHIVCDPPSNLCIRSTPHPVPQVSKPAVSPVSKPADPSSLPLRSSQQTLNSQPSTLNFFDESRARHWLAAMDYGFAHYTVFLLACTDSDGNTFVVDEHAERLWLPQRHAAAIKTMLARHRITAPSDLETGELTTRPLQLSDLARIVAGADVFSRQSDGTTIADQYAREGIRLRPANTDRINGWAEILQLLGDPEAAFNPPTSCEAANHSPSGSDLSTLPRSFYATNEGQFEQIRKSGPQLSNETPCEAANKLSTLNSQLLYAPASSSTNAAPA